MSIIVDMFLSYETNVVKVVHQEAIIVDKQSEIINVLALQEIESNVSSRNSQGFEYIQRISMDNLKRSTNLKVRNTTCIKHFIK